MIRLSFSSYTRVCDILAGMDIAAYVAFRTGATCEENGYVALDTGHAAQVYAQRVHYVPRRPWADAQCHFFDLLASAIGAAR